MLDKFLAVAFGAEQKKTASRQLVDKLKTYPLEELKKLASGDPHCKLAYAECVGGIGGGDGTWLGKYKGTPLFSKAVQLEKQLLEIDMQEQQARAQMPQPSDAWQQRDAIRLQQRLLDLDLVMAENGGDPTVGAPAEEELSVADAPALALEQEDPPKAPEGPPTGAAAGGESAPSAEELLAALEQEGGGPEAVEGAPKPPSIEVPQPPVPSKPKASPQQAKGEEGKDAEESEEAPPKKDDKSKEDVKQAAAAKIASLISAGSFMAKAAAGEAKLKREIAKKHPDLAKTAEEHPEGHHLRRALLGNPISSAIEAKPGQRLDAFGAAQGHSLAERLKGGLKGGLGGAALGGAGGLALALANKGNPAHALGYGAGIGGGLGLMGGNLYGAIKGDHDAEASRIHAERSKHRNAGEKVANMLSGLINAGKSAMPGIAGAAQGAKSLATTAHAAGGMPQVAKSFGSVAKNFAQKNPLTAAGVAGAGGLVAGKALSNSQPRT